MDVRHAPRRLTTACVVTAMALVVCGCERSSAPTPASTPGTTDTPTHTPTRPAREADPVVAEVLGNILRQPVGDQSLADFDLPEPFLRRIADRVIRASYQDSFHVVFADRPVESPSEAAGTGRAVDTASPSIVRASLPPAVTASRRAMSEDRPARRGFVAPILADAPAIDAGAPPPDATPALAGATTFVGRRLAPDGLLATTIRVIERLGPEAFVDRPDALREHLRATGLPVDLLRFFDVGAGSPLAVEVTLCRLLATGLSAEEVVDATASAAFAFTQTRRGFRVMTESGEHEIGLVRAQLTRGTYWRGPGSGGSVDVLRQLVTGLPDVEFIVSIERRHLDDFRELLSAWPLGRDDRMTIAVEPLAVAQWAQDNGKAGVLEGPLENGAPPTIATLLPRYASRRNDGSVFVPGESFLADGLAAAGLTLVQSPLVFQGGNLMAVRDPVTGQGLLLIGEAEVYRNTAIGLTPEQTLEAFRVEFGVDRCAVLPSASFHVDYDFCVRAHDGVLVAFVNDRAAAVRLVMDAGIAALERGGALTADAARAARAHLAGDRPAELLGVIGPAFARHAAPGGEYAHSFAEHFAAGPADSPIGNLQRMLVAMDVVAAGAMAPGAAAHPQVRAYLAALRRADTQRASLHEELRALGFRVVPVPGLSEGGRSLTYVNGIHDRTRYVMPAYGGLYADVDAAAAAAFSRVLGPGVRVIPVLSGESQRRSGAVHCSVSVSPVLGP